MYYGAMREKRGFAGINAGTDASMESRMEGRLPIAHSAFLQTEEIDREREMSGWNPYAGEEEMPEPAGQEEASQSAGDEALREQGEEWLEPYFMKFDYAQVVEDEQETERELRKLQSMYPEAAKRLLPYVEEECDKMEYEGSPMFDEYPDRSTVYRLEERIYHQVKDQFPEEAVQETKEVLTMQYPDTGMGNSGRNRVRDLARVLLLQEMHHRRCRYSRCKYRKQ